MNQMKEEWDKMTESMNRMDDMMKQEGEQNMDQMRQEWNNMKDSLNKMKDMMGNMM